MIPQDLLIVLVQVGVPLGTLAAGLALFGRSEIGKALIHRLRSGHEPAVLTDLADEVERLQERVAELEERSDFAERILASDDRPGLRQSTSRPSTPPEPKKVTPV